MKVLFAIRDEKNIIATIENKYQQEYGKKITCKQVKDFTAISKELQKNVNYDKIVIDENIDNNVKAKGRDYAIKRIKSICKIADSKKIIYLTNDKSNLSDLVNLGIYNVVVGEDKIKKSVYNFILNPNTKKQAIDMYNIKGKENKKAEVKKEEPKKELGKEVRSVSKSKEKANTVKEEKISTIELFKNIKYLNKSDLDEEKCIKRFNNLYSKLDKDSLNILIQSLEPSTKKILKKGSKKYNEFLGTDKKSKKGDEEVAAVPAKKRGRPRKVQEDNKAEEETTEKKRRGRPRKVEVEENNQKQEVKEAAKKEKSKKEKVATEEVPAKSKETSKAKKVVAVVKKPKDDDFELEDIDLDDEVVVTPPKKNNKKIKKEEVIDDDLDLIEDDDLEDIDLKDDLDLDLEDEDFDDDDLDLDDEELDEDDLDLDDEELDEDDLDLDDEELDEDDLDLDDEELDEDDLDLDDEDLDEDDLDLDDENLDEDDLDLDDENLDEDDLDLDDENLDEDDLDLDDEDLDEDDLDLDDEDLDEDDLDLGDEELDEDDLDLDDEKLDKDDTDLDDDELDDFDFEDEALEEDNEHTDANEEDDDLIDLDDFNDESDSDDDIINLDDDSDDDIINLDDDSDDDIINLDDDSDDDIINLDDDSDDDIINLDDDSDDDIINLDDDSDDDIINLDDDSDDDDDIINLDDDSDDDIINLDDDSDDDIINLDDDSDDDGDIINLDDDSDDDILTLDDDSEDDVATIEDDESNEEIAEEDDDLITLDDDSDEDDNGIISLDDDEDAVLKLDDEADNGNEVFSGIKNKNYNPNYDLSKQISAINDGEDVETETANVMHNINISEDKKVVAFVGGHGNGTSFIVNNLANLLSGQGIKVAILDLTKNRNSYYIYTENEESLRSVAFSCFDKLKSGIPDGIKTNKNLTVYTTLPNSGNEIEDIDAAINTLLSNHSLVLLDCDIDTDKEFFAIAQEIYLVQSLDILTIQPLTSLLKKLKMSKVLDESKIRILVNKDLRVNDLNDRILISAMSVYNSPDTTYQLDLFNRDTVQYLTIPFEEKNYAKYLSELAKCKLKISGYSKPLISSFNKLAKMVYPIGKKKK